MKIQLALLPALFTLLLVWQVVLGHSVSGDFLSNGEVIGWTILLWFLWFRFTHVRLVTDLKPHQLQIALRGMFRSCNVPLADIETIDVMAFDPLKDYGGFGIRALGKGRVCLAYGNRGVMLMLKGGTFVLVGSQHPEVLAEALRKNGWA